MSSPGPQPCPGCGLVAGPAEGPTHAYIGASPGCWARYGELLAAGVPPPAPGQLAVDAYAVQHPGVAERRAAGEETFVAAEPFAVAITPVRLRDRLRPPGG